MKRICVFLDEPFSEAVLKPNFMARAYRPAILGSREKRSWVSETEIVNTNMAKWKKEMPPSDRILFESVAGDLLKSLGYETEGKVR